MRFHTKLTNLFSNAVNLRREIAILYNRVGLVNLVYHIWYSYTTSNISNNLYLIGQRISSKKKLKKLIKKSGYTYNYWKINSNPTFRVLVMIDRLLPSNLDYTCILYSLNSYIESLKVFLTEYEYTDIFSIKFLFTFTLSTLFFILLFMNFYDKHLNYFEKVKKNFSVYKLLIIFFILVILLIPRIYIRHFITTFIFNGEITFISLAFSILLVLPFMVYISNIVIKLLTRQIIKKDFSIFNDTVINSINLYTIFIILFFVYIGFNGYYYILFSNIFKSVSSCMSPTTMHILPRELSEVFSWSHGERTEIKTPLSKIPTENWKFKKDIPSGAAKSEYVLPNPYGRTLEVIENNRIKLWDSFLLLSNDPNNKFSVPSFTVSNNVCLFGSASILVQNQATKTYHVYMIGIDSQCKKDSVAKNSLNVYLTDKEKIQTTLTQLRNMGKKIDDVNPDALMIAAPNILEYTKILNYFGKHTHLVIFKNGNMTCLDKPEILRNRLPMYTNIENLFTSSAPRRSYELNKNNLNITKDKLNGNGAIFSNKDIAGFYTNNHNKVELHITTPNGLNIPFIKCNLVPDFTSKGIIELNKLIGLNIFENPHSQVTSYIQPTLLYDEFKKVRAITSCNVVENKPNISIDYPFTELISTKTVDSSNLIAMKLMNVIKRAVGCLDHVTSWYRNSNDVDKIDTQKLLKNDLIASVFDEMFESSNMRGYIDIQELSTTNCTSLVKMYRYIEGGATFLLVSSKDRLLFDNLEWQLGGQNLKVPVSIDYRLKHDLSVALMNDHLQPDRRCFHNRQQFRIVFWDNFNVEFAITESYCKTFCANYSKNLFPELEYILFEEEDGKNKSILNLLNLRDQRQFFDFFNKTSFFDKFTSIREET